MTEVLLTPGSHILVHWTAVLVLDPGYGPDPGGRGGVAPVGGLCDSEAPVLDLDESRSAIQPGVGLDRVIHLSGTRSRACVDGHPGDSFRRIPGALCGRIDVKEAAATGEFVGI